MARGVARIIEKYRHKLLRGEGSPRAAQMWNSDYFVPFLQFHYGRTRTLTSLTTQIDLSRTGGWSRYFIPFETLIPKGITKRMYDRGYLFIMNYSLFFNCISLLQSSITISKSTCTCLCICIGDELDSHSSQIVDLN
jgi:hypothetical protein